MVYNESIVEEIKMPRNLIRQNNTVGLKDYKISMSIESLKSLNEKNEFVFDPKPMSENEESYIKSCILDGHPIPGIVVQERSGVWILLYGHKWIQVALKNWDAIPKERQSKLPEISVDVNRSWHPAYKMFDS